MAKTPKPIEGGTVIDYPELIQARKQVAALLGKQVEIRAIIGHLQNDATSDAFNDAVQGIIEGKDPVAAAASLDNSRALEAARSSLTLVTHAIARAQSIEASAMTAARKAYEQRVLPRHRAISAKLAVALAAVGEAQREALAFEAQTRADGLPSWNGVYGPVGLALIGDPVDGQSLFAAWFTAAVYSGAIDKDIVPADWTANWSLFNSLQRNAGKGLGEADSIKVRRLRTTVAAPTRRGGKSLRRSMF